MKNFLQNLKHTSLVIIVIIGVFTSIKQVQATWNYSTIYSIPYDVILTNLPPVVNAGIDRSVTLPTNSITIPVGGATATDLDGTIVSTAWTKISGPATFTIANGSTLAPTFSGLVQGSYTFRLTATDNSGATGQDDMIINVNAPSSIPPVANAGPDLDLYLPTSATSLSGSGTDADGTVVSYYWTGTGGTIVSPNSAFTSVTGLAIGTYTFTLKVTDNDGLTDTDDVIITVSNAIPIDGSCSPNYFGCITGANAGGQGTNQHFGTGASDPWTWSCPGLNGGASPNCKDPIGNTGPVVDGSCSSTHFGCITGANAGGQGTNQHISTGSSDPWTWSCPGLNGGASPSCSEPGGGAVLPACNDGIDNDVPPDGLIDYPNDPGCDGPNDTSEKNIKIKEIEI